MSMSQPVSIEADRLQDPSGHHQDGLQGRRERRQGEPCRRGPLQPRSPERRVQPGGDPYRPGALQDQIAEWRAGPLGLRAPERSEEHTSELQSLMRISYAVFCLKKKKQTKLKHNTNTNETTY